MAELKVYTVEEAAELLKVGQRTVLNNIRAGKLRASKIGAWRIREEDLVAYLDETANINPNIHDAEQR